MNVFVITPSYLMDKREAFAKGVMQLSRLGLNVVNQDFPEVLPSPREKAEQLNKAFADPEIDMILAQRGGYSAMKSLPFVDFDLIRRHPKILAGFSDLSALLNPIFERTGLVTLHAPMVINLDEPTPFTVNSFMNAVSGYPEKDLLKDAPVTVYNSGIATGVLKGGNLITITALIGTQWDVTFENSVVFLEDVDEKLHQVDRYLTQWILAGKFRRVRGVILGDFRGIKSDDVYDILASQMDLDFPVIHCPYVGHVDNKITLPVGAEVELNADAGQLRISRISFPGAKP